MQTVLVVGQLPPPVHGSNVMAENLLNLIREMGFRPSLVQKTFSRTVKEVNQLAFRKLLIAPYILFSLLIKVIFFRPNVCIYFLSLGLKSFLFDSMMLFILKLFRVRYILYIHGVGLKKIERRNLFLGSILRIIFHEQSHVVILCHSLYDDLPLWINRDHVFILPNFSEELDIGKDKFNNLLFFSNIRPEKGIFEFLELARHISDLNTDITFTIAGPFKDGFVEGQVLNYISKYKIRNISILGPVYDKFCKENLFSNSGILIFPSHTEALPLIVIEAFSAGLPVIASSVGCIPEIITNGYDGYVYDEFNVETISSYVKYILSDDETYFTFSSNCIAKYCDKYTRNSYKDNLREILEHVMKSNHS